jgi:N-succinyldiaminopimelate aminotransferase
MSVSRLKYVTRIGVEQMGELADSLSNPAVLRLENLDTNIAPPQAAVAATRMAAGMDEANSYLPFLGMDSIRQTMTGRPNASSAPAACPAYSTYCWQPLNLATRS